MRVRTVDARRQRAIEQARDGLRERRVAGAPGAPLGMRALEPVEQLRGARAVEGVGREDRAQRTRAILEREGDDDEDEQDGQQCGPEDARVEHRRAGL